MAVLVRLTIAGIGVCETNLFELDLIDPRKKRPEIPDIFFFKNVFILHCCLIELLEITGFPQGL